MFLSVFSVDFCLPTATAQQDEDGDQKYKPDRACQDKDRRVAAVGIVEAPEAGAGALGLRCETSTERPAAVVVTRARLLFASGKVVGLVVVIGQAPAVSFAVGHVTRGRLYVAEVRVSRTASAYRV